MDSLSANLIWLILRYEPKAAFILEIVNADVSSKIRRDVSQIQYFLEEAFGQKDVRELLYAQCKQRLELLLSDNYRYIAFQSLTDKSIMLRIDVLTKDITKFMMNCGQDEDGAGCVFLNCNQVFFCGSSKSVTEKESFLFDFETQELEVKAPMLRGRYFFGMCKFAGNIYVFMGRTHNIQESLNRKGERYTIDRNEWNWISEVPDDSAHEFTYAISHKDAIYISGYSLTDILRYNVQLDTFSFCQLELGPNRIKIMFGNKENVYILTSGKEVAVYSPETNDSKTIQTAEFPYFNTQPIHHNGIITWARIPHASPNTITLGSYEIATSTMSTSEIPII